MDAIELLRPSLEAVYESYTLFHKTKNANHAVQQPSAPLIPKEETSSQKIELLETEEVQPANPFLDNIYPTIPSSNDYEQM